MIISWQEAQRLSAALSSQYPDVNLLWLYFQNAKAYFASQTFSTGIRCHLCYDEVNNFIFCALENGLVVQVPFDHVPDLPVSDFLFVPDFVGDTVRNFPLSTKNISGLTVMSRQDVIIYKSRFSRKFNAQNTLTVTYTNTDLEDIRTLLTNNAEAKGLYIMFGFEPDMMNDMPRRNPIRLINATYDNQFRPILTKPACEHNYP